MRYLKLASAKNPNTDFIELNDFNGFLCTSFQSLGITRKLEFLAIQNKQFVVDNKPEFKKYSLTVEILSKYSEYERFYKNLISFIDRNKKEGFRLYYRPYDGFDLRYCICSIENSVKTNKMQPIILTFVQNSLWFGEEKTATTSQLQQEGNLFAFEEDLSIDNYYSVGFYLDEDILNYYCVSFYSGIETQAYIRNDSYNEIPLMFRIYGKSINPTISLFRKGESEPIKKVQVFANIDENCYVEINADISKNGVWYITENKSKIDYSELINNALGSPYFYVDNGEYYVKVIDEGNNICVVDIVWQEEFSE